MQFFYTFIIFMHLFTHLFSILMLYQNFLNWLRYFNGYNIKNVVAKIFSTPTALVCEIHILQNVGARCKLDCKVKDTKGKGVKLSDLDDTIMDAWQVVVNSPSKELYADADAVLQFIKVCKQFPKNLNHVESSILEPLKGKMIKHGPTVLCILVTQQLIG